MTRKENTFKRDNYFSSWCREKLPESKTGFMVSDIDFILYDYKFKRIMLIETKCMNTEIKTWQKNLFKNINKWIAKGIDDDWKYDGFHLLVFENTNFSNGKVFFDHKEISENELLERLSFGKIKQKTKEDTISDIIDSIDFS